MTREEVLALARLLPVFEETIRELDADNPWHEPCERFAQNLNRTVSRFDQTLAREALGGHLIPPHQASDQAA
jgi:hypothetical protein